MPCLEQRSITRSRCLKPSCLRTRGFWSSEKPVDNRIGGYGGMASTFKVTVIKWEADAIESKVLEENCICILEECLEELRHANVQLHRERNLYCRIPGRRNTPSFLSRWSHRGPPGSETHIRDTLSDRLESPGGGRTVFRLYH